MVSLNTALELLGSEAKDLLDFEKVNGEEYDKKLGELPGRFGFHSESGRFFQKQYSLTLNGKSVKGPIWLLPGMADNTVGVALGYGRGVGRVGGAAGFNAYEVRIAGEQHFAVGAKLESAGSKYEVACTQEQGVMDGRPVIRECNADDYLSLIHI